MLLLVCVRSQIDTGLVGPGLKRGCFAVIGDLAEHAAPLIASRIPELVPELTRYIANGPVSASHNASWAIGQIALYAAPLQEAVPPQHPPFEVYVGPIVQQLARVMIMSHGRHQSVNLVRNACLTVGRLALRYAQAVAEPLSPVFGLCCQTLERTVDNKEKMIAIQGLCNVSSIQHNLVVAHLPAFLRAVLSLYVTPGIMPPPPPPGSESVPTWSQHVPPSVHEGIAPFLSSLKATHAMEWEAAQEQLEPAQRRALCTCFSL